MHYKGTGEPKSFVTESWKCVGQHTGNGSANIQASSGILKRVARYIGFEIQLEVVVLDVCKLTETYGMRVHVLMSYVQITQEHRGRVTCESGSIGEASS